MGPGVGLPGALSPSAWNELPASYSGGVFRTRIRFAACTTATTASPVVSDGSQLILLPQLFPASAQECQLSHKLVWQLQAELLEVRAQVQEELIHPLDVFAANPRSRGSCISVVLCCVVL